MSKILKSKILFENLNFIEVFLRNACFMIFMFFKELLHSDKHIDSRVDA